MFQGSHSINMDSKGRIAMPTRVRESLDTICGGRIVITANYKDRCLLVYPEPKWQEIVSQIKALPNTSQAARRLQLIVIGYANELELDSNGRVLLAQTLRDYAGIDKKLMLFGQMDRLELWSAEGWQAFIDNQDFGEDTEEMKQLSL
ncbi:division/cell wall cluster transcriptional repressor MraZ [Aurantivibrio infirmus]